MSKKWSDQDLGTSTSLDAYLEISWSYASDDFFQLVALVVCFNWYLLVITRIEVSSCAQYYNLF